MSCGLCGAGTDVGLIAGDVHGERRSGLRGEVAAGLPLAEDAVECEVPAAGAGGGET